MNPLVSIIIPTHRPDHFVNALNCAIAQTYKNIEIIVSDNSNSDEIHRICQSANRNIIYRKNLNGQPKSNVAQPLSLASGDFIKYLFDDDLIAPHCIDSMIGWLNRIDQPLRDSIGMITSARHVIDENSVFTRENKLAGIHSASVIEGDSAIRHILSRCTNFIGEFSTIMFRSEFIDKNKPESIYELWNEDFSIGLIDVPLYLRILQSKHLLYIPASLSAFRLHAQGGSDARTNPNYHHAFSDWLRLANAAYQAGRISESELLQSAHRFTRIPNTIQEIFHKELAPWKDVADEILAGKRLRSSLLNKIAKKPLRILK